MTIKYVKADQMNLANLVKILMYGSSGSGKTWGAAMASLDLARVLIAITETQGLLQVRQANPQATVVHLRNLGEWGELVKDLHKPCKGCRTETTVGDTLVHKLGPGCPKCKGSGYAGRSLYDTIVVDGITDLQRFVKTAVEGDKKRPSGNNKLRMGVLAMDDWQVVANYMQRLLIAFRDLPYHVVVTAISEEIINQDQGEIKARPFLQGNATRSTIGQFFNVICHLQSRRAQEGESDVELVREAVFAAPGNDILCKANPALKARESVEVGRWIEQIINYTPQAQTVASETEEG